MLQPQPDQATDSSDRSITIIIIRYLLATLLLDTPSGYVHLLVMYIQQGVMGLDTSFTFHKDAS